MKDYVQDYQARSMAQSPSSINSIADMKRFVEEYPEFRKLGGNVSKHVALVGELSRLVGRDKLLEVGEVEQGLATSSGSDLKVCHLQNYIRRYPQSELLRVYKILLQTLAYRRGTSCGSSCCMLCAIRKRRRLILHL